MAGKSYPGRETEGRVSKSDGAWENPAREQDYDMTGNSPADRGASRNIGSDDPNMRRTGA